jgi:hypothetical protein
MGIKCVRQVLDDQARARQSQIRPRCLAFAERPGPPVTHRLARRHWPAPPANGQPRSRGMENAIPQPVPSATRGGRRDASTSIRTDKTGKRYILLTRQARLLARPAPRLDMGAPGLACCRRALERRSPAHKPPAHGSEYTWATSAPSAWS